MEHQSLWKVACVVVCAMACSGPANPLPDEALTSAELEDRPKARKPRSSAEFVDVTSYITNEEEVNAWYSLVETLERDFDAICGDTFCEGDFSNYESLSFRCSVDDRRGTLGQCAWVFAASQHEVVPRTGAIDVVAEHWVCPISVPRGLPLREFIAALSSSGGAPLHAPLPGASRTTYDALVECL